MCRLPLLALLLLAACDSGSRAAGESVVRSGHAAGPPVLTAAEEAIGDAIERGEIPGAVLTVGWWEGAPTTTALGQRAVEPDREPMTADTLFDLASLTKVVATAASVVKLVERGSLTLESRVADHLPAFGQRGKQDITVLDLLLHRSGLVPDNPLADYAEGPEVAWERICALKPEATPGTRFSYSDVGYIVLAGLVRAVDGRRLDEFCAQEFFEPLGMHDTTWNPGPELVARCAPTEQRDGRWMRGEVHDPRAHALGGVAGHAGLFSTAGDLARWCRMILGGGELDGVRVLSASSVSEMTRPRWLPDRSGGRALGFDVDTAYSSARGERFPRGASFGHTGFTGTSLWIDPESASFVILLTSRVHPDGSGKVVALRRLVATEAALALDEALDLARGEEFNDLGVLTGADVLERTGFEALAGARVALITNVSGRLRSGERTVDLLARADNVELVRILSPEHGFGASAEGAQGSAVDAATGLRIESLYGETRRPTPEMLRGVDTLVVDLQDVGTRFYTYTTTVGYSMEVAAELGLRCVILDRPNPIGGVRVAGPCADEDRLCFISYRPIPVVHGMTLGELGLLFVERFGLDCELEVVPMEGWRRAMLWDETGLTWVDPSPNLRNPTQALLYPAMGLLEGTNLSVGRGTDEPFERLGAPWIDGRRLARALTAAHIPGLSFTPIEFTPRNDAKLAGERCGGVHLALIDRDAFEPVQAGLTIAWHLNRLFGAAFDAAGVDARLFDHTTWEALMTCADPGELPAKWAEDLREFKAARARVLLYD